MKEGLPRGGRLRRVTTRASRRRPRGHVARWFGSQSPTAGLLLARGGLVGAGRLRRGEPGRGWLGRLGAGGGASPPWSRRRLRGDRVDERGAVRARHAGALWVGCAG